MMLRLLLTVLLFSFVLCVFDDNGSERILGGSNALLGQFQYMASLRPVGSLAHIGGGVLISSIWVLTAATNAVHFQRPADLAVALGIINTNLAVTSPGLVSTAQQIIIHSGFEFSNAQGVPVNNIALVRIPAVACNAARFGIISPIVLESSNIGDQIGGSNVVGWGSRTSDKAPNILLGFSSVSSIGCGTIALGGAAICASRVMCNTDIGGPLVIANRLIGIASYTPCLDDATVHPDLYMRISSYRIWITINTGI